MKGTFFTYPLFFNNKQFEILDKNFNRDNYLYCFYLLKKKFGEKGINLSTQDINKPKESEFVIFFEMPKIKNIIPEKNNYLLIYESPLIRKDNWNLENHKHFKKIFTWNDNFVDNKKYFKINYSFQIPKDINFDFYPVRDPEKKEEARLDHISNGVRKKEKLCALIAGNKFKSHPQELYSQRIKAIRWFEKNHPQDFDLYGMGWDRYYFQGHFLGINLLRLNRLKFLAKLLKPNYPSYKGTIISKQEVCPKYKFAFAYENTKAAGYITEKIFDCFFNGTVPIYLGAPNITDYIPENTFVDKRKFKNYEELYSFIKNMPDKEYINYLKAIENFLKSNKIYTFSADYFAEKISQVILSDII